MFIGREREIEVLEDLYSRKGLNSIAIYGRRRVGKTTLLSNFCQNKRSIFFTANEISEKINLQNYQKALLQTMPNSVFGDISDFEQAMDITVKLSKDVKTVLVIDEFPFLANAAPYFPSILQRYMDHEFKDLDITVILCGSSIRMMDDELNGKQKPLFGRFSRQMRVEPLNYIDSCKFIPNADNKTCAMIYGITGGIPLYLKLMSKENNFKDAIIKNFLQLSAPLLEEPVNLIRQEFTNPSIYLSIITAVANGKTQIKEISETTGIDKGTCSNYVSHLESVHIIRKEVPMANSRRKSVYELNDGLFRFRYGVIEKAYPDILAFDTERAYMKVEDMLPMFMGKQFEEICKQYVTINTLYRSIGKWWGSDPERRTDAEIDIVAVEGIDNKSDVLFCSCKFRSKPMNANDLEELVRTSEFVNGFKKRSYALFSLSGFTEDLVKIANKRGYFLQI